MRRGLTITMVCTAVLLIVMGARARVSEEEIHPWRKVSVTVEAGQGFGTVQVTCTAKQSKLSSISVSIRNRKVSVPARAVKGLPDIELSSLAVHSEVGYGPKPWLYVVLQVPSSKLPAGITNQWVYFKFQGGKFKGKSIKSRTKANQYKFKEMPI